MVNGLLHLNRYRLGWHVCDKGRLPIDPDTSSLIIRLR